MSSQLIPYPVAYEGILSRPGMSSPLLLDAIRFAETGHLSPDKANQATSSKGAIGAYQLKQNNLHDMGYGVRPNITVQEARDPVAARQIAHNYINGYRNHHGLETIQDSLAAYNMGANAYSKWKASGGDWNDLPNETKQYLVRASRYIDRNPEQFNNAGSMMANFSQMQPQQQTQGSNSMAQSTFNPSYTGSRTGMVYPNATNTPPNPNAVVYPNATNTPPNPNAVVPLNQVQPSSIDPRDPALLAAMQYEKTMGNVQLDPSINSYAPPNRSSLYTYDYKNTGRDYESLNDPNSFIAQPQSNSSIGSQQLNPQPSASGGLGNAILDAAQGSPFFQYMNDGTVTMKGMTDPLPALLDEVGKTALNYLPNNELVKKVPSSQGVLDAYNKMNAPDVTKIENVPTTQGGALTTGNRYNSALSMSSPKAMDINEMMIRMGSAGLGQAQNGGLAMMSAAGTEYGNLMDQQRTDALAAYEASLSAKPDGKDTSKIADQIAGYDQTLYDMQMAKGLLEKGGLTGFLQGTLGSGWDSLMGNPEAGSRLLLKKLRVDDALLRVAQTKGAISNNEMKLFLSPAPSMLQDEQVWIDWINQRMQAMQNVRNRLAQGVSLDPSQVATTGQINQFGSSIGTPVTLSNGATVTKLD